MFSLETTAMHSRSDSLTIRPPSTSRRTSIARANTISYKAVPIEADQTPKFHSNSQSNYTSKESPCIAQPDLESMSMAKINNQPSEEDLDSMKKESSNALLTSEDENDRDGPSMIKTFVDQASQVNNEELKSKQKKKKSEQQIKKARSSPRRPKPAGHAPATPAPNSDSATPSKKVTIEEPVPTKRSITVDTSKARSNLEVVRLCIRELGWKEVN